MKIIINADDFGANNYTNKKILQCIESGNISSTSWLANGDGFNDALRIFNEKKILFDSNNISNGAHLNLVDHKPLTRNIDLEPILNRHGEFDKNKIRDVVFTNSLRNAIFGELQEQVQTLLNNKLLVTHLDSHMHTHTIPSLYFLIVKLSNYFSIKKIRISRNVYLNGYNDIGLELRVKKYIYNFSLKIISNFRISNYFTSFKNFFIISDGFKKLPSGFDRDNIIVELMTHPGARSFEEENKMLSSDWKKTKNIKMQIISYNNI